MHQPRRNAGEYLPARPFGSQHCLRSLELA